MGAAAAAGRWGRGGWLPEVRLLRPEPAGPLLRGGRAAAVCKPPDGAVAVDGPGLDLCPLPLEVTSCQASPRGAAGAGAGAGAWAGAGAGAGKGTLAGVGAGAGAGTGGGGAGACMG